MRRFWTKQEEDYVRVSLPTKTIEHIANHLNRTPSAVKNKLTDLGIKVSDYRTKIIEYRSDGWTATELKFLQKNAGILTSIQIAEKLNRTVHSVKMKARYHNLALQINPWTEEDIDLLGILVKQGMNWKEIASVFERTEDACRRKHAYIYK